MIVRAIATLINALDKAQDRVRIHRGKPLPSAGDAKRGRKLTGKPVGAVIELQELKRIEQAQPEPEPLSQRAGECDWHMIDRSWARKSPPKRAVCVCVCVA
jgi:hypothetical protein